MKAQTINICYLGPEAGIQIDPGGMEKHNSRRQTNGATKRMMESSEMVWRLQ